jgi:hypothetical protein
MDKGRRETLTTRIISTTFVIVALAVFKPFGLETWQWQAYVHLLALWVLGVAVCMLTDMILKYIVKMPRSLSKGANYIIKRNLWFQLINTPLIALIICLYRHFVLSDKIEANQFSLINYLESFAIIAFCSFAIGLYWRFKFRSRYLAAELEETRLLNEQLQKMQRPTSDLSPDDASLHNTKSEVTLTGTTSETITLDIARYALKALNVDSNGLDEMDLRILSTIIEKFKGGPVGINNIATAVGEDSGTVEEVYEPYLIQEGYLQRTPRGREATELAYQHLGKIKTGGQGELF